MSPRPGPGKNPPGTLGESVVRLQVNSDRSLISKDFFSPVNNTNLDRDDTDLGSGAPMAIRTGSVLPRTRTCWSRWERTAGCSCSTGTTSAAPGRDPVVGTPSCRREVRTTEYGATRILGGDGGYVYHIHNGGPLSAFKVGVAGSGLPSLTRAGTSTVTWGYTSGSPIVTSNGTTSGSALVWGVYGSGSTGANGQLRAYEAVPVNGRAAAILRPDRQGQEVRRAGHRQRPGLRRHPRRRIFGFGRPTTSSLSGSPTDFGYVAVGTTANATVTVTALRGSPSRASRPGPRSAATPPPCRALATGQTLGVPVSFTPTTATSLSGA